MRRFAISDIHGCAKSFQALLDRIELRRDDRLFLLGDYIDRGPGSRQVIDSIMDLQARGFRLTCLMGNHEQLMLDAGSSSSWSNMWIMNGGGATLKSFQAKTREDVPDIYMNWLRSLPTHYSDSEYLLVHAGLNFLEEDPLEDEEEMLWIRDWYEDIDYAWLGERRIVHGHTPQARKAIKAMARDLPEKQVLNIDAGCVFSHYPGLGNLCAFDMDKGTLVFQACIDT